MTEIPPIEYDRTEAVDLNTEMQRSYIDYAMTVIVSRALPDVRDGLKPVHRRVVYAMYDGGYRPDRGYNKCSRVVGEVMGQYHPHGDSSIYDALVRLVQDWSLRYPLVDGQGNFGSPGDDPAAAPRYTECRMAPLAMEMVRDIDEETVDFRDNYDGKTQEPVVLPSRFPNLLVNGSLRHRGRHGDQHPAAQPARGGRRRPVDARQPGGHPRRGARRGAGPDQRSRLPHRRADPGPQGHRGRLPHRPWLGHHARGRRGRGDPGPPVPRGHRAALPGEPRHARAEDRRAHQGGSPQRHRRHPRRDLGPHRPAPRHRAQARRGGQGGAQQPLQAHPAAEQLRRQHARPGRRGAAHAADRRVHPALGRAPDRGHPAADEVPAAQGRGRDPHPAWSAQGARRPRRGDRPHPRARRPSRRPATG